ncbi:MAG: protein jag [Clostridia bacterium]|nr:protein jag [Clostridia bacterium]
MKRELIVTAKSVEEARKKAAAELGLREEEMTVTVLEEGKRGFLGIGAADAKIAVGYEAKDETVGVDAALNFIRQVAENMGLENLTYETKAGTNDDVILAVDGDNAGLLIGHHGETLDALQYLSNLAANKRVNGEKHEYVKITLDVENYREKREAALRALARRKAEKVLREKRSVMLEPMNPYERRIIQSEVQGIEGVSTNSIGVDSNRRVVIFLEGESVEDEEI